MNLQIRGLNPDETYCCTISDVKSVFRGADIDIRFGKSKLSRSERENNKFFKPNKNCDDRILAYMAVRKKGIDQFGLMSQSYINFFILDKNGYTEELRQKFVKEILPQLKLLFETHKHEEDYDRNNAFSVTVGLNGDKFNLYISEKKD